MPSLAAVLAVVQQRMWVRQMPLFLHPALQLGQTTETSVSTSHDAMTAATHVSAHFFWWRFYDRLPGQQRLNGRQHHTLAPVAHLVADARQHAGQRCVAGAVSLPLLGE